MTLSELRSKDLFVGSYKSVEKAKIDGIIPQYYHDIFKDKCDCGSERIIRISGEGEVTLMLCCNPYCYLKLPYQIDKMFKIYDVKGLGVETANEVVTYLMSKGCAEPRLTDIFKNYKSSYNLTPANAEKWLGAMNTIANTKQSMGDMIDSLSYPYIGTKFKKILGDISTPSELLQAIQKKGHVYKFLIDNGISDELVLYSFKIYFADIYSIISALAGNIIRSSNEKMPVFLTGHLATPTAKYTKKKFIVTCNMILDKNHPEGKPVEVEETGAMKSAVACVAGEDSVMNRSSNYEKALVIDTKKRSADPNDRFLYSPEEFLKTIALI